MYMPRGTLILEIDGEFKTQIRVETQKEIDIHIDAWKHLYALNPKGAKVSWQITLQVPSKMSRRDFKLEDE